jgi:hypothetical protein
MYYNSEILREKTLYVPYSQGFYICVLDTISLTQFYTPSSSGMGGVGESSESELFGKRTLQNQGSML